MNYGFKKLIKLDPDDSYNHNA